MVRPNMKSSAAVQIIDLTSDNGDESVSFQRDITSDHIKDTSTRVGDEPDEESDEDDGDAHSKEQDEEEQQPWESESLYADALEAMGDNNLSVDPCK